MSAPISPPAPNDAVLEDRLRAIVSTADLEVLTMGMVRRQLEKELGVDLRPRKEFLSAALKRALSDLDDDDDDDGEAEDDGSDEGGGSDDNDDDEEEQVEEKAGQKKKKKRSSPTVVLSEALGELMGRETCMRGEVSKWLWAYFKENKLQDPKDGRVILLDDQLQAVFKRKKMTMFQMNRFLVPHMKKPEEIAGYNLESDDAEDEDVEPRGTNKRKRALSGKRLSSSKQGVKTGSRGELKRPMSAYMHFVSEKRAEVMEDNPGISFGQVGKKLGELWRGLSDPEKAPYEAMRAKQQRAYDKATGKKGGKSRSKTTKGGDVKRPMSAYMHFVSKKRAEVMEDNPGISFGQVGKKLGELWRGLSDPEKAPYEAMRAKQQRAYDKATGKKGGKSRSKTTKGGDVKRPMSAYMHFVSKKRAEVMEENPGISFGQVGKKLGELWRGLSDPEKAPYEAMRAKQQAVYDKAMNRSKKR